MTSSAISSQLSKLEINTATAGAKTITAAAIGNPVILTSAAHGLANGDVVAIAGIVGTLSALNGTTQVVQNVTANTFSVDFNALGLVYTSGGTATPQTWTQIANVKTFNGIDGSAAEIDISNLQSSAKEYLMGLPDEGQFSVELDLDPLDAGQIALLAARSAQTKKSFKLTLPNANTATFSGYAKKITASGGVDQSIKRSVDIRITGVVTWA